MRTISLTLLGASCLYWSIKLGAVVYFGSDMIGRINNTQFDNKPVISVKERTCDHFPRGNAYSVVSPGLITHIPTGLMWTACPVGVALDDRAGCNKTGKPVTVPYRVAVSIAHEFDAGGYNDWRIPTVSELSTLHGAWCSIEMFQYNVPKFITHPVRSKYSQKMLQRGAQALGISLGQYEVNQGVMMLVRG